MCQGGDPEGSGRGGPGYRFEDELPAPGRYEIGSLAMANAGPNTNGSQFFIVSGPDGVGLPPSYSLFGKVVKGLDVVKAIESVGSRSGAPVRAGHHRVGDHHRGRLTRPSRWDGPGRSRRSGRAARPVRPRPGRRRGTPPPAARPADRQSRPGRGSAPCARGSRPPGCPAGASSTDRWSFSPCPSSWVSPKWGTTATPADQAEPDGQPAAPGVDHRVGQDHGRPRRADHHRAVAATPPPGRPTPPSA